MCGKCSCDLITSSSVPSAMQQVAAARLTDAAALLRALLPAGAKALPLTITLDSDIEATPVAAGRQAARKAPAKGTPASAIDLLSDSDAEGTKPSSRKKPAGERRALQLPWPLVDEC